jgi:hypothetical protein
VTIDVGQRVRVHVNLHLQRLAVADPLTARILCYVDDITLQGITFRVQEACVDRVQATGRRKVCAYAVGTVVAWDQEPARTGPVVTYNPHRSRYFHFRETGEQVNGLERALFADLRVYVQESQ